MDAGLRPIIVATIGPTVMRRVPGADASVSNAASRSRAPSAGVRRTSTTSPCRLSISTCAPKQRRASLPLPFLASRASGSVVDRWVSLRRRSRQNSTPECVPRHHRNRRPTSGLHLWTENSSPSPGFNYPSGRSSVPSTLKCSSDNKRCSGAYSRRLQNRRSPRTEQRHEAARLCTKAR